MNEDVDDEPEYGGQEVKALEKTEPEVRTLEEEELDRYQQFYLLHQ